MNQKRAQTMIKARKKLLGEKDTYLLKRITLNKKLRQVQRELDGIDTIIIQD